MPTIDVQLDCTIRDSFRARQAAGMFDLAWPPVLSEHISAELPDLNEPWDIGVIVGPSGSGKSSLARAAFGDRVYRGGQWPADRAVIDAFGDVPIRVLTRTLCAVGLGSPPSWLKPYAVLSTGERFRCDLAAALLGSATQDSHAHIAAPFDRSLHAGASGASCVDFAEGLTPRRPGFPCRAEESEAAQTCETRPTLPRREESLDHREQDACLPDLVVFDEFTSVVDRTSARIGSWAIAKAIRRGAIRGRLVAVTCHYDVLPWLAPDWVLDMSTGTLARGRLRRPELPLVIRPASRQAWSLFSRHHYLSGELHPSARCFVGWTLGQPAAFAAVLPFPHPRRPGYREHRLVCLPEFQGVGIGAAMSAWVAGVYVSLGKPYFSTSGHPAVIRHRMNSPLWIMRRRPGLCSKAGRGSSTRSGAAASSSRLRLTAGFEYVGPARAAEARALGLISQSAA